MVRRSSAGLLFHQADDQEDSPVYGSHLTRRQMTKGRTQLVPTEYRDFVSTMIWDRCRKPFVGEGSTVILTADASAMTVVTGHTSTLSRVLSRLD